MHVVYKSGFTKDIKNIKDKKFKQRLKNVLLELENSKTLFDIKNVKKIASYTNFYRIRVGEYRLGIEYDNKLSL